MLVLAKVSCGEKNESGVCPYGPATTDRDRKHVLKPCHPSLSGISAPAS